MAKAINLLFLSAAVPTIISAFAGSSKSDNVHFAVSGFSPTPPLISKCVTTKSTKRGTKRDLNPASHHGISNASCTPSFPFHLSLTKRIIATKSTQLTMSTSEDSPPSISTISNSKHILFDMPVSNNGAQVRTILYKKNILKDEVEILPPSALGGLKSPEYLKLSPLGLMPCLAIRNQDDDEGSHDLGGLDYLVESDTISRYLLTKYAHLSPSFQPDNPKSNLICRWNDMYLTTIQGCLYKPASRLPLGDYADRKSAIRGFIKNINVIESFLGDYNIEEGIYLCGKEVSLADAALFPTLIFANYMLPKFNIDGSEDGASTKDPLPPKLSQWFHALRTNEPTFTQIYDEIMDVLQHSWDETNHRWDSIHLAGVRDTAPPTIFDKIISKEIPATIVREDDYILAFKDINPQAPVHILVIPKDRNGLTKLRESSLEHTDILGRLLVAAAEIAKDDSLGFGDGARVVINDGVDGGQEVGHLHVHVLGGRKMEGKLG